MQLLYSQKKIFLLRVLKQGITNLFTALNLFCGCFAAHLAFKSLFEEAFLLVLLGVIFDLFDGFFARTFKVENDFGLHFDSMADLVTSGLVPGIVMFNLISQTGTEELNFSLIILQNEFLFSFNPYSLFGFLITLATGVRLAKFNISKDQDHEFIGLPAPANALLVENPLLCFIRPMVNSSLMLFLITLTSSVIMNIRFRLFSFKIKYKSFKEYSFQMILLLMVFPAFYFFNWSAIPLLVIIYLILNLVRNINS